ncbi:hypothetical protein HR060_06730 [Catenovulum sp. SM1970]|uniref:hypothetical protein n=1 Tax=Marinifaba aquimaris TaxID=2741323 RepID=UPI0015727A30|nr:hypothetical protein [Marinifaba aquimaris]NTS76562.1 hypothetical protein [Marinifaba aquimaris]
MQEDKITVKINPPENKTSTLSDLYTTKELRPMQKHPIPIYRGTESNIEVLITNHGIGHDFPGGAIDQSEAWVDFRVYDANKKLIHSSGHLTKNHEISKGTTIYKEIPVDREGKDVWRHDLFNMVGKAYLNTIPSGDKDFINYAFYVPDWASSPLTISSALKYRTLNPRYLKWVNKKTK